jgi:hypothetical protein
VPQTFILTAEQRESFDHEGVLRLPGFFSPALVAPMADAIWQDAQRRFGVERDRPETWTEHRIGQHAKLRKRGVFDALGTAELRALADMFLGPGTWDPPRHWAQPLLVTFPGGDWDVPHNTWHLDLPATDYTQAMPMIRFFVFLEPVLPRGGGTPYIAGSHRVVMDRARTAGAGEKLRSSEMRKILEREEPWFASLLRPGGEDRVGEFMRQGGTMRGVPVRVGEMTGEAGDLIVMHPAMIHTVANNALDRPRLTAAITLYTRDCFMEAPQRAEDG